MLVADVVLSLDVLYHILGDEQDYMVRTMDKMMEKTDKFLIIYAQDSRNTDRFDIEYKSHLYNSKWFQYMENKKDFELMYEQEEPFDKSVSSAQFFVYRRVS